MNQNNNKSSFKSFVIVAAFLAIFGSLVYSSRNVETLDKESAAQPKYKKTVATTAEETKSDDTQESPFKPLLAQKPDAQSPAVLQASTDDDGTIVSGTGSDGTNGTNIGSPTANSLASGSGPQSSPSVPQTGNTNMTVALALTSITLAFGLVVLAKNPRKLALARFEKKITKKL